MSMYDINNVPMDSQLWQLIAYCAGTGGSLLVIGSAAGVALMGMEKVRRSVFVMVGLSLTRSVWPRPLRMK